MEKKQLFSFILFQIILAFLTINIAKNSELKKDIANFL